MTRVFIGNHSELQGATIKKYYYHGSTRVAEDNGTALHSLLSDHLRGTAVTTNAVGARVT